jgi:hypothetical protein
MVHYCGRREPVSPILTSLKLNAMRDTTLTCRAVLIAGLLSAISTAAAEPVKYSPLDKAFEVTFPEMPQCKAQNLVLITGRAVMHVCSHANVSAQLFYSATFYEGLTVPEHVNAADALKGAMNGAASNTNSTVLESHSLEVSGLPALECVMRDPNGLVSVSQYVLANQRMFSIEFAGRPGRVPKEAVNSFMNSFKLHPK